MVSGWLLLGCIQLGVIGEYKQATHNIRRLSANPLPVVCGLILSGYRWHIYTAEMGISLLGILNVVILGVLIWWNARSLSKIDDQRSLAEKALQQALEELEQRVEERTVELKQVNAQLSREISDRELAESALRFRLLL